MTIHVSKCMSLQDTWQTMCQQMGCVRRRRGELERKSEIEEMSEKERTKERKKIKKRNKINKRKEKEKKERKMKEAGGFFLNSLAFRRSELVRLRSKVRRFDEGLCFKR